MNADALRKLYADLTDEELRIAGANLDAYLALAWEIWEEMREGCTGLLDDSVHPSQDAEERSIPHTN